MDIAGRDELWAVSLAFHLPLVVEDPGCRQWLRMVYRTFLSSPQEGSGALYKTHCVRLRLFPGTPGSTFLFGLWKRSWDEAVILTMMRILTD